jgi:uridine kinase
MAAQMNKKPFIMGIAGGSGSGKTFFLKCFLKHFSADEVSLVSQDDYYFPVPGGMTAEENKHYNFDLPSTIDHDHFEADIHSLLAGRPISKKEYTFNNPSLTPKILEIKPAPIIIVEGLFILHFRKIAEMLDMKIFMDADEDIALQRRLKRDLMERGYPHDAVMYKWLNHVMPAYKQYLLPYKGECNRVIVNNTNIEDDILSMTDKISIDLREKIFR